MSSIPGDGPLSLDGYFHDNFGRSPSPFGYPDIYTDFSEEAIHPIALGYGQELEGSGIKPAGTGAMRCRQEAEHFDPGQQLQRIPKSQSTTDLEVATYSRPDREPERKSLLSAAIPPLTGVKEQWHHDSVHDRTSNSFGFDRNSVKTVGDTNFETWRV